MTSILPCVMSWDVRKTSNLDGYGDYFGRYERANGRLDDMEVSDEINACSVEIEVDVNGVKEPWLLMFKMKPTTTQRKLNHLVERLLVSVEPFVTHCQAFLRLPSHAYLRCWRYYSSDFRNSRW